MECCGFDPESDPVRDHSSISQRSGNRIRPNQHSGIREKAKSFAGNFQQRRSPLCPEVEVDERGTQHNGLTDARCRIATGGRRKSPGRRSGFRQPTDCRAGRQRPERPDTELYRPDNLW